MPDTQPDYSLNAASGDRDSESPSLVLLRHFRVQEADYMKPPLREQLLDPDGEPAPSASSHRVSVSAACTCNTVCTCVPVSACACNTVCTCNTVSRSYQVPDASDPGPVAPSGGGGSSRRPTGGGSLCRSVGGGSTCFGGGGGYGGYWAPCF